VGRGRAAAGSAGAPAIPSAAGPPQGSAGLRPPSASLTRRALRPAWAYAGGGAPAARPPQSNLTIDPHNLLSQSCPGSRLPSLSAPAKAESPQGGGGRAGRQPAERPAGSSCKAPGLPRTRRGLAAGDGPGGQNSYYYNQGNPRKNNGFFSSNKINGAGEGNDEVATGLKA